MIDVQETYYSALNTIDWNFTGSISSKLHSIHPYPAKFIPEIPRTLISNLPIPHNSVILDPFCGSGVTLSEAQNAGIESVGVDLNPIACLLSRVKTNILPTNFLSTAFDIVKQCQVTRTKVVIPDIPNLDHWFKKDIQRSITLIIKFINEINETDLADCLRFCVSSIIVKVSNQESDTRYAAVNKVHTGDDVFAYFLQKAKTLSDIKSNSPLQPAARVINKSSLKLNADDFNKPIGLIITSPPYPNAYEYWLYHKYRMWWLGFDPIGVKEQEIGARAHYFKKNHQTEEDFILQMEQLFNSFNNFCVKDTLAAFIIGRSKIHGKIVFNEKIIEQAGEKNGFKLVDCIARTINPSRKSFNLSHARIKEEYLVILQKKF